MNKTNGHHRVANLQVLQVLTYQKISLTIAPIF